MKFCLHDAKKSEDNGDYYRAIDIYTSLNLLMNTHAFDLNIILILKKINKIQVSITISDFFIDMGIEKVYVLNLNKRQDRRELVEREMRKYGLEYQIVTAVDGCTSKEAISYYDDYISRDVGTMKSSSHIPLETQLQIKKDASLGAFGYILTNIKVFENAIKNGYKKICIFDDDVFFSDFVFIQINYLKRLGFFRKKWKVLLLGASEYSEEYPFDLINESYGFYNPIPNKTCGSFANCYDSSVFEDILLAAYEMDGPFDNTALGSIYSKYHNECFVICPSICIADVENSNIRTQRDQLEHSNLMRWPITKQRYLEYKGYVGK